MKRKESKTLYFLIVVVLILAAFAAAKGFFSKLGVSQIIKSRTPETIDAWKAKWDNEVSNYCKASVFNSSPPEFQRATSLVLQRFWDGPNTKNLLPAVRVNEACLDIQFASSESQMAGADGVFLFSKENSGPKSLKILVSPNYKQQDDLMTAMLLSHELTHVEQFILQDVANNVIQECRSEASNSFCDSLASGDKLGFYTEVSSNSCVRMESQAFLYEIIFYTALKPVEQSEIVTRANNSRLEFNVPALSFISSLNELTRLCPLNTIPDVNNFINCLSDFYVRSQPFYQKECNL